MKIVQETTDWSTPNHVYVLSDDMRSMIAYLPMGTKIIKRFKKPIGFDPRGRTFVAVK